MAGKVSGRLELDTRKLGRELKDRNGVVGNIMRGFASVVTTEVRAVARSRVKRRTGAYLNSIRSTVVSSPAGPAARVGSDVDYAKILEKGSRSHVIEVDPPRVLRFEMRNGAVVYTRRVKHPGTQPYNIIRDGVIRAGRKLDRIT